MKKKFVSTLLIIGMLIGTASCAPSSEGAQEAEGITLSIMGKDVDLQKSYMASIFEQYEAATGNRLDIIAVESEEYEAAVLEKAAENELPDLLLHFNNAALNSYDFDQFFYYVNDESWVDELTGSARAYCEDGGGNLLGLPFWENSVSGCYYNKTLLESLGLRAAATQAEFDALCQALTDIGYTPICWPLDGCNWMYQFGLDPVFADDPALLERLNSGQTAYADIPAVENMARWISDAAAKGWFGSSYADMGWDDISPAMGSGEAVMVFIWDTWFYTDFGDGMKYTKDDFALMPVFMGTADRGTYEGGNLNMIVANKNSERLDTALEFLDFCADAAHYNVAFDGVSTVSCFTGQTTNIQSEMVTAAMPSITENERASTAEPKIAGYTQEDTAAAFRELLEGKTDVHGCIQIMDERRMAAAHGSE